MPLPLIVGTGVPTRSPAPDNSPFHPPARALPLPASAGLQRQSAAAAAYIVPTHFIVMPTVELHLICRCLYGSHVRNTYFSAIERDSHVNLRIMINDQSCGYTCQLTALMDCTIEVITPDLTSLTTSIDRWRARGNRSGRRHWYSRTKTSPQATFERRWRRAAALRPVGLKVANAVLPTRRLCQTDLCRDPFVSSAGSCWRPSSS